jgi:hypothetical protein
LPPADCGCSVSKIKLIKISFLIFSLFILVCFESDVIGDVGDINAVVDTDDVVDEGIMSSECSLVL